MPGNIISINESKDLQWYVGDSKMPELMKWLEKNGYREEAPKAEAKQENLERS